jgi:calcium binding protein
VEEQQMAKTAKSAPAAKRHSGAYSTARLDQLIEEAIVDAYGDSEQTSGFYTMLEDHLDVPFTVEILGAQVTVDRVDLTLTDDERIVAVCRHGKTRHPIIFVLKLCCFVGRVGPVRTRHYRPSSSARHCLISARLENST